VEVAVVVVVVAVVAAAVVEEQAVAEHRCRSATLKAEASHLQHRHHRWASRPLLHAANQTRNTELVLALMIRHHHQQQRQLHRRALASQPLQALARPPLPPRVIPLPAPLPSPLPLALELQEEAPPATALEQVAVAVAVAVEPMALNR
jgi:hypothetical protein